MTEQAREQQRLAREHAAANRLADAWYSTARARRLVDRAADLVESGQ